MAEMLNRTPDAPAPSKGPATNPAVQGGPPEPSAAKMLAASASATLDMAQPPAARTPEVPEMADGIDTPTPERETPTPAATPTGPAPESRSINELAKDPAVQEALKAAIQPGGAIKYDSLKAAVQTGLDTGEFTFKSAGQEKVVKGIIADAITPRQAEPTPAPGKADGPAASGPVPENAKAPAVLNAIEKLDPKIPNGLDVRVKAALTTDASVLQTENAATKGRNALAAPPTVEDGVRYANAMAVKPGAEVTPEKIVADFKQAMAVPTKGGLYDLATDQGVKLYPKASVNPDGNAREGGSGRDVNTAVTPESVYGRAITAAKEKGVELPAPADPEKGYTVGEARGMKDQLDLDSVSRARETPAPAAPKPAASLEDRKLVLDTIATGNNGKPGLPLESFKELSNPAKNELRGLVKGLGAGPEGDIAGLMVTAALAKEIKEKVLKNESAQ